MLCQLLSKRIKNHKKKTDLKICGINVDLQVPKRHRIRKIIL